MANVLDRLGQIIFLVIIHGRFVCTREDNCGFDVVVWHEQQCPKAPSAPAWADQSAVVYGAVPASSRCSVGHAAPGRPTRLPSHAARINWMLQILSMARPLRSSTHGVFLAWRGLLRASPVRSQHRLDDKLSVVSALSWRGGQRRKHRRRRGHRPARKHLVGLDVQAWP